MGEKKPGGSPGFLMGKARGLEIHFEDQCQSLRVRLLVYIRILRDESDTGANTVRVTQHSGTRIIDDIINIGFYVLNVDIVAIAEGVFQEYAYRVGVLLSHSIEIVIVVLEGNIPGEAPDRAVKADCGIVVTLTRFQVRIVNTAVMADTHFSRAKVVTGGLPILGLQCQCLQPQQPL